MPSACGGMKTRDGRGTIFAAKNRNERKLSFDASGELPNGEKFKMFTDQAALMKQERNWYFPV